MINNKTKKPLVINLFGGPGSGKSTCASYLFSRLKILGYNVELVTEFAKEKAWENNKKAIKDQLYILGEQSHRMTICEDSVDIIITDSPLLLSIIYCKDKRLTENFSKTVIDVFNSYDNLNFYLMRDDDYKSQGRFESKEQSINLDDKILKLLEDSNINYLRATKKLETYDTIIRIVENIFEKQG